MKKLLSVCLVLSMLLALVACGGDTPASTASGASPASGSGTSAEPSGKLVIYSPQFGYAGSQQPYQRLYGEIPQY